MRNLLIRADASTNIGIGHVMRCLALAQAWQAAGGRVTLASCFLPEQLQTRLISEKIHYEELESDLPGSTGDAIETCGLIKRMNPAFTVLDGYAFSDSFECALTETRAQAGCGLLVLDDHHHAKHDVADFILNQNLGSSRDTYGSRGGLLIGPDFALLRKETLASLQLRGRAEPNRILVTFGGGDTDNITQRVISALMKIPNAKLELMALVGSANPHIGKLRQLADQDARVKVMPPVNNMGDLLAQVGVAVCAGGSTNWEMCYFGIPRCVFTLADNQEQIVAALSEANCAFDMGWSSSLDDSKLVNRVRSLLENHELRREMSEANMNIVDGLGASRVVQCIIDCPAPRTFSE